MNAWWNQLLLVMCGGALGAGLRFWIGGWMTRHAGDALPWGTLTANLVGAFCAGFIAIWLEGRGPSALYWRALLIVGVLGGLTTFSALMLESLLYAKSARGGATLGYLAITLAGGLVLVWLGARLAHAVRGA